MGAEEREETEAELIHRCQIEPYPERTCTSEFSVAPLKEGAPMPVSGAMQNAVQEKYWNTEIWYSRVEGALEVKHTSKVAPKELLERLETWGQENDAGFKLVKSS
uniref:Uncharacterized protein n=1 Tax=Alexandrium catenella TaxID=2925 RepID=A0A7S1SF72_ALECA|mmetsp:Transcript_9904/g.26927  ORF Transcript_9904/g.26927 Transcript_9904/m.26927 type:complete len:105 (+) Transcript_9904:82-396(+)